MEQVFYLLSILCIGSILVILLLGAVRKDIWGNVKSGFKYFLFIMYIGIVVSITLLPIYPNLGFEARIPVVNFIPFKSFVGFFTNSYGINDSQYLFVVAKNLAGNILMFLPFGFFIALFYDRKGKLKLKYIVLYSAGFSLLIEFLQYLEMLTGFSMYRVADIDDLILNLIGGICGYFAYKGLQKLWTQIKKKIRYAKA